MNWSEMAEQQQLRNRELAQLIAANEARAEDAQRMAERANEMPKTMAQREHLKNLAKAIMDTALHHISRLGVTAGIQANHGRKLVTPENLTYYEAFTSKPTDRISDRDMRLARAKRIEERKQIRLKREQEQALAN